MHVHLIALRYFRETVRHGSMRQAAEALNVAPSAINRQILKLEEQLECRLFERQSDGVRLTAPGEVLFRYARELDAGLDRAISEIEDLRGLRRGHVALAAEDGIARDLLPPILAGFRADFPRVTHALDILNAPAIVAAVAEGAVDLGLAMYAPRHPDVAVLAEASVALGVLMPNEHPLAARATLRLSDIAHEQLVLLKDGVGAHPDAHEALRRGAPRSAAAVTTAPGALAALVRAGFGLAVRSRIGIAQEIAQGELAFVVLDDPRLRPGRLALLGRQDRALPVAAALLAERLKQTLLEMVAGA